MLLFVLGAFSIFGGYISIYYVFGGDMLKGASYGAMAGTLGSGLGFAALPFVAWLSKRYQKHNALRIAIAMMIIGSILNFWCLNPTYPLLMYIVPFFYSLGIASIFTILGALQADVVDVDELKSGHRREGMFGAAGAYFMKAAGALAAAISGFALQSTGFNVALAGNQTGSTFLAMRVLNAFGPALLLSICMYILHNYPITEEYINKIRPELERRRALKLHNNPPAHTS